MRIQASAPIDPQAGSLSARRRRSAGRAVVVRHLAFEDLGVFAGPIEAAGFRIHYVEAGVDDLRLAAADADLLFMLGGPISSNDEKDFSFVADEIALLSQRIAADLPTMGICLGAQLIARAAGARVAPATAEIGIAPIALTDAGRDGVLAAFAPLPAAMHWHGEACELPSGATLLASSADCAVQAFGLGERVIAFQFHPELAPAAFEQWLIGHSAELSMRGLSVHDLRGEVARFGAELERKGRTTIEAWLDAVAPRARRVRRSTATRGAGGTAAASTAAIAKGQALPRNVAPIVQFMLTREGVTWPDALRRYRRLAARMPDDALPWVGFSNRGPSEARLEVLGYAIHDDGRQVVVEIAASTTPADEIATAELAKRVGASCLIGGRNVEAVLHTIARSPLRYFPLLDGDAPCALAAEALRVQALGADGVLLRRQAGTDSAHAAASLAAVRAATHLDIILADEGAPQSPADAGTGVWARTTTTQP